MKVTAFIKYDDYPFYVVVPGDLQENFDVKVEGRGTYGHKSVLGVKPLIKYEQHRQTHDRICLEYCKREAELRLALLAENGVNFIHIKSA